MNTRFFVAEYPRKSDYAAAEPILPEYDFDRCVRCPQCGQLVSGGYWMQPRSIKITKRKLPDFLYTDGDQAPFLLSREALTKIQEAGLTGITAFQEIEASRFQRKAKAEMEIPSYYHIELARSRITIDHDHSVIVYGKQNKTQYCPLCNQVTAPYDFFRTLSLNTTEYEGYDIFYIYELGGTVFFSQRFIEFYHESGLTNLHFLPAQKHCAWVSSYFLDGDENA